MSASRRLSCMARNYTIGLGTVKTARSSRDFHPARAHCSRKGPAFASPISRLDQQNGLDLDDYPVGQGTHADGRTSMAAGVAEHLDHKVGAAVDDFGWSPKSGSALTMPSSLTTASMRASSPSADLATASSCSPVRRAARSRLRPRRPCRDDRPENCRRAASAPAPKGRGDCPPSDTARSWPRAWGRREA